MAYQTKLSECSRGKELFVKILIVPAQGRPVHIFGHNIWTHDTFGHYLKLKQCLAQTNWMLHKILA